MDQTILVIPNVTLFPLPAVDGQKFVDALDLASFEFNAAFWLYESDIDDWRLYVATPTVDSDGSREAYSRIHRILSELAQPIDISLSHVRVVSPSDPIVRALKSAYKVETGDATVHVRKSIFEGVVIEDALVYRIE